MLEAPYTIGPVTRAIMAMRADLHPFHGDALRFFRPEPAELHPDAAILDLWRRRVEAHALERAATVRLKALTAATAFPDPPETLFVQDGDRELGIDRWASKRWCGRRWYVVAAPGLGDGKGLRQPQYRKVARLVSPWGRGSGDAAVVEDIVPWPEAQARADAIVAACDGYQARMAQISAASGLDAADAEWDARNDDVRAIDDAICDATAHTVEGLQVKARLAQIDIDDDLDPWGRLIVGLVRDILAMGA